MTPDQPTTTPSADVDPQAAAKVVELLRDTRFVMLTSLGTAGDLLSRPMTIQEVTDDGDLWFFIGANTDQARALAADPRVNVGVSGNGAWVSVAGTGHLSTDRATIDRLWNSWVDAWFPGGKDDPNVALLRVEASSAEYWDSPGGGRVASLISFVKAKVTGEPLRGDNEATELP